jgi:iron complex outermembrane receptor protein
MCDLRAVVAAVVPFVFALGPAWAQEAPRQSPADLQTSPATFVDTEVITVRARRESRFDAPLSSELLQWGDLDSIRTLDEVATAIPGLWMINDQDPGTNIVSMRGVTTDRLQQAAVVFVLDGVPLADTEFFTGPLFDLASVQVLRGPQGALFGKGAAGGVIAVNTEQFGDGYGLFGAGNGAFRIGEGAIGAELGDGWQARLSGQWRAADGWITNRTLGRVVDAEESRSLRLRVTGDVFGPESVDLGFFVMQDDGGAAWASSGDVTGDFGGVLEGAALTDPIGDFEGRASRQWVQARARVRFATPLGEVALLAARDEYQKRWVEELDYRPGPLTFFGVPAFPDGLQPIAQPTDIEATTLEARLTGNRVNTDYVLGVFGQFVDRRRTDDFGPLLFGGPPPDYATESEQIAAFAGVFQRIGPLRLEAQARFDSDHRSQAISVGGALVDRRGARFERLQPRLGLSYALLPERLVAFAAYGEGFRSGGFNPRPGPGSAWRAEFEPEVTRSLEAGIRVRGGLPAGRSWRLEATAFSAEIDQYQNYTFLDGQSVTLNVDRVSVEGGEVSGGVNQPLAAGWLLSVEGGWATANSRIDRYEAPDPLIAGAVRDYSGRRVPNAPEWTSAVTAKISNRASDQQPEFSITRHGAGETFFEIDNALRAPARSWWDAEAHLRSGSWTISVWGRNITDERWAVSAFGQGMLPLLAGLGPGGPFDTFTINRGRQFGVSVRREF